jgi:hypothetical protein
VPVLFNYIAVDIGVEIEIFPHSPHTSGWDEGHQAAKHLGQFLPVRDMLQP